jgi:DNA-directed RNA polymerase beta' subunit
VDAILTYYEDLNKAAKRLHKSFEKIKNPYLKYVRKVQKVVDRKTDWNKFSKSEKLVVENAIRLAQLLHRMCSVQLTTLAPKEIAQEKVNTSEINRVIADANFVYEQLA